MSLAGYYSRMARQDSVQYLDSFISSEEGFCFDLQKWFSNYSGYGIRIERASDSTTLDIGYDGALIDVSAINTFCSGTEGRVVRIYDQFPNLVNGYQGYVETLYVNAPVIYEAGSVVTEPDTGLIAMKYNGNGALSSNTFTNLIRPFWTYFGIYNLTDSSSARASFGLPQGTGSANYIAIFQLSGSGVHDLFPRERQGTVTDANLRYTLNNNQTYLISYYDKDTQRSLNVDAVNVDLDSTSLDPDVKPDSVRVGGYRSSSDAEFVGYKHIDLMILADKSVQIADIENVINSRYLIYS